MKANVKAIKQILPGEKKTFKCEKAMSLVTAKSSAYYVQNNYPELGVRYKVSLNYAQLEVTIEAVPVEKSEEKEIS